MIRALANDEDSRPENWSCDPDEVSNFTENRVLPNKVAATSQKTVYCAGAKLLSIIHAAGRASPTAQRFGSTASSTSRKHDVILFQIERGIQGQMLLERNETRSRKSIGNPRTGTQRNTRAGMETF